MKSNKDTVLEIERGFWEKGNDPEYFKENSLKEGFSVIESMGFVDQPSAVKMAKDAKPWKNVKMQDIHAVDLNDDCIAIGYHGEGSQEGMDQPYRTTVSSLYVRRDGKWKLAVTSHQGWSDEAK